MPLDRPATKDDDMPHLFRNPRVLSTAGVVAALAASAPPLQAQYGSMHVEEAFTFERFEELQREGALILVDIFADWCPVCAIQQDVLQEFRNAKPYVPLYTLTVDFDSQKEAVAHFRAPRQSTLILYRGTEQLWYSVAETRREVIFKSLDEAIGRT